MCLKPKWIGTLDVFPAEIVLKVLKYLDARDLLRCEMVCKTLKAYIEQDSATQYVIRLAMCGYTDGRHVQDDRFSTTASCLQKLQDHMYRWKHLDYVEERIKVPVTRFNEKLAGGIYAYSCLGLTPEARSQIVFIELPSIIRESPLRMWSHENDFPVVDFEFVPSEDLLVLLERVQESDGHFRISLHLRTLLSNEPHPEAACPMLIADPIIDHDVRLNLLLYGDSIGLYFRPHWAGLILWNWRTGDFLHDTVETSYGQEFLGLIGPKTLLTLSRENGHEALAVYDIIDSSGPLHEVVRLQLPTSKDLGVHRRRQCNYHCRKAPKLGITPSGPVPFVTSGARILHFDVVVASAMTNRGHYVHISDQYTIGSLIPLSTILKYSSRRGAEPMLSIPWTEWGLKGSLLLRTLADSGGLHGSRFVEVEDKRYHVGTRDNLLAGDPPVYGDIILSVFDFTPNLALWPDLPRSSDRQSGTETEVVGRPGPSPRDHSKLGTRLPYWYTRRKLKTLYKCNSVRVDDEHILLFMPDSIGHDSLLILTL